MSAVLVYCKWTLNQDDDDDDDDPVSTLMRIYYSPGNFCLQERKFQETKVGT